MKKILYVFLALSFLLSALYVNSYELSNTDYDIIESTEDKVFAYLDENYEVDPQIIVNYIYHLIDTRDISERSKVILEVIADDIEYSYYLWQYQYDEMSPDDCYDDEYYDEQDKRCYFDESLYDQWEEEDFEFRWEHAHDYDAYDSAETVAEYSILWETIKLISWKTDAQYEEVWEIFSTLIPLSVRSDMKKYKIVNLPNSDTYAHVEQDEEDITYWNITVNIPTLYDESGNFSEESIATLIHEFSHILTLSKTQVRYYPVTENESILDRFTERCETHLLQEWCLEEESYLDDFMDIYWSDEEYLEQVRNEEVYAYDENPSHFVTDYAATNPAEDIAESFTYFVLNKKPTASSVADEKLLFFYNYDELSNLRKQIRSRLSSLNY